MLLVLDELLHQLARAAEATEMSIGGGGGDGDGGGDGGGHR